MFIIIYLILARALFTLGVPMPDPKHLQTRETGDNSDPFIIDIDCERAEEVCNADCYAILCLNAPNPVQLDKTGVNSEHRKEAGINILKRTEQYREERGVFISDQVLAVTGNSGEETINALNQQAGKGEVVIPVHAYENSCMYYGYSLAY